MIKGFGMDTSGLDFSKSILVADDTATMRIIVKKALKKFGFENVDFAEDGSEAVAKLDQGQHFDLVICDWNMPGIDGLNVLKHWLKVKDASRTSYFLMLTAKSAEIDSETAKKAGVSGYLTKPFSPEELLSAIRPYLKLAT